MSAPLVVNTSDGTVWTRREAVRDGQPLYALADCQRCPELVMATYAELEGHGISGSADVLPVPVGPEPQPSELERLRAQVAELEAAAYGDAEVRLLAPLEQIRHLHACVAAQMSRADTLDRLCREQRVRADAAEANPLAWAEKLDAKSLDNFLIALGSATEYEPMDGALARVEEIIRSFREAVFSEPGPSVEASADKLTQLFAPVQAFREDEPAEEAGQLVEWCTGCNTDHDPDQCGYRPETGGAL